MSESWREAFHQTAREFIADFVANNSGYSLSSEELTQGWSNHVALGSHEGEAVVFKYYSMTERWKNELFCLRHFAPTGCVPDVHAIVADQLIVMSFVPGTMPRRDGIDEKVLSNPDRLADLSRQLGQATGKLVATPLPTDSNGGNSGRWNGSGGDKERSESTAAESIGRLRDGILRYRELVDFHRWFPSLVSTD